MHKKALALLILLALLAACTASETGSSDTTTSGQEPGNSATTRLDEDYADALSVQGQLALGTVQLDKTDLAVDEGQAAELLPLWQALQTLSGSDTTAQAELDAVVNQIQDTMTAGQIEAIAAMALTTDSMAELVESGELAGFGRGFNRGGDAATGGRFDPGGFPPGGVPGGGFPQGGGPGGGPGGFGGGIGNLSEGDLATRQAQFASGEFNIEDRMLQGMVVRLLQTKTGEIADAPRGAIFDTVYAVVTEAIGLSVEEVQAQMAEGSTLSEIVESNGGDVEAVRTALIEALGELPDAGGLDLEAFADGWLNGQ